MHPSTEAEQLLIQHDIQFHCPTAGHFVIDGLADPKLKITWYPRSCKLQISKQGNRTKYEAEASLQGIIKTILTFK